MSEANTGATLEEVAFLRWLDAHTAATGVDAAAGSDVERHYDGDISEEELQLLADRELITRRESGEIALTDTARVILANPTG